MRTSEANTIDYLVESIERTKSGRFGNKFRPVVQEQDRDREQSISPAFVDSYATVRDLEKAPRTSHAFTSPRYVFALL